MRILLILSLLIAKGILIVCSQTIEKIFSQYIVSRDSISFDTVSSLKYSIQNTLNSRIVFLIPNAKYYEISSCFDVFYNRLHRLNNH